MNIGMIALGCAKNRVDAEMMLKRLQDEGFTVCGDLNDCDAIIVHTCTFIDAAKEESIGAILDAAAYKETGRAKRLIVTGCMAQRYQNQVLEQFPEVDACLGAKSIDKIAEAVRSAGRYTHYRPLSCASPEYGRTLTTPSYSVYLRIAEGCSNHCTYCVIPSVRGEFQPRPKEAILREAEDLAAAGAKEINLIAQDPTRHPDLCELIRRIGQIDDVKWIRLLYCYPDGVSDELLQTMAQTEKCVPYMDVPVQHASGRVLRRMNRRGDAEGLTRLVERIRRFLPGCSVRTTFITGFPGETEEDFEILCNFVKQNRFANLGVFPYSREEGTAAARMRGQIPDEIRRRRAEVIMEIQHDLLPKSNRPLIGKVTDVLCEGRRKDGKYFGRAYFQAPEVDGKVIFTSERICNEGEFVPVLLRRYREYDFYGIAQN